MQNLSLQQLVAETREALAKAGASKYYQHVFKTVSKQFLIYAVQNEIHTFSMDIGIRFLEDHYSMSQKIEEHKWPVFICGA